MPISDRGSRRGRSFAALVAMSLFATLLSSAATLATAPEVGAAVPPGAPANPTQPCTWNWNRWSVPGAFSFPYTDSSFDPTQRIFSQVPTALGANGWYAASSGPTSSHSGLPEGVGPAEVTTGANDSEWTYGVGFYRMSPGTSQTITISDGARQESHAFAFYNSAGEQFGRFPRIADANRGVHYIASEQEEKSNPTLAGGFGRANAWSSNVTIRVPDDGIVYIHYLNFDERLRTQFASFGGACGPSLIGDESLDNVPGTPVTVDVAANDTGINPRSIAIVGANGSGTRTVPGEGTWSVNAQGGITFSPEDQLTTNPTPIEYTAADQRGNRAAPAELTVTYQPIFAQDDESRANVEGSTVSVNVIANDSHIDPRSVAIVGADPLTGGRVVVGQGSWSLNSATGAITFVPLPGYEGDPTPISYTSADSRGNAVDPARVVVTYAPEVEADESLANTPGDAVTIEVLENDPSRGINPSTVAFVGEDPATGLLDVPREGVWSADPVTGEITFTPGFGFAGDPSAISYTVADRGGDRSEPAEVVLDYTPLLENDLSVGNPAGGIVTIEVLSNDPSNDLDPTTVVIDHPDYNAETRNLVIPAEGTWSVDGATGGITFVPNRSLTDDPTPVSYIAQDDEESPSPPAQLDIRYLARPATLADVSDVNRLGFAATVDVLSNDPSAALLERNSVLIIDGGGTTDELLVPGQGTWLVDPESGNITFTPIDAFEGNPAPIEYLATDNLGVRTVPTLVTVSFIGAIIEEEEPPSALAFAEDRPAPPLPSAFSLLGFTLLIAMLLAGSVALTVGGRSRREVHNAS